MINQLHIGWIKSVNCNIVWFKRVNFYIWGCRFRRHPLCVPSDSDPNFQKSYQNLITFWGEILPNSDSKF